MSEYEPCLRITGGDLATSTESGVWRPVGGSHVPEQAHTEEAVDTSRSDWGAHENVCPQDLSTSILF